MRKIYAKMLTVLTAALFLMPTMLRAQDQMVIVTCQGDMHLYPASVAETFQYDAEQDIYTLVSDGQTVSFGGQDIKQIRFADKTETAQDPLLTPKETDKYNPNFEHPEVDSYEILLMDTALCHAQVQFKEDVPQLYVGKILSLENDTAAYNCYVLTYKIIGKKADIRFRFASIEELIYNTEFVLAANPDNTYFETKSASGDPLPVYRARRTPGLEAVPKVEIEKGPVKLFAEMGMSLTSADKSSLDIDAKFKLSEPRRNEKCARSFLAKIEYMGFVARGTYEKTTTLELTPRVGINFEKDKYLEKPLFKASGKFMIPAGPVVIPLWLDLSGTLGYNIQAAIDRAHSEGGGTVVLRKGRHRTGALFFPRGVDLHLDRGATLVSIVDTTLYPLITTRWEGRVRKARAALLNFDHNEGCRLSGEGTIDAQGLEWKRLSLPFAGRPKTVCFDHCDGGTISGVHIRNQAFWCVHILFTNGFTVDGIDICAEDYIPSSDGIDIDSSTGVTVRNTHIQAHDDCISIKSGRDTDGRRVNQASQDILIEHCHFDYGHGGVAIGSEVSGGVRNVTVRHCDMAGENWNPIRFKSQPSRGGVVENILFEDIDIAKARNVVEVNMTWRMKGADEPPYSPRTVLRNIRAHAERGGIIQGFEEQPIPRGAISFENCLFDTGAPLQISHADVDLSGVVMDKF